MNGLLTRIVSILMVIVFPCAMTSAEPNAMVYADGNVTINSSTVSGSSVIVAGDNVQTGKSAMAMISHGESTVRLSSDSSVVYQSNGVELNYGAIVVATKNGMKGHITGLSISPASAGGAKFGLVNQKNTQAITALEGSLQITDGTHTVALVSGETLVHHLDALAQPEISTDQDGQSNGQTQTKEDKNRKQGGIPGWGIVLVTGITAGGILGGLAFNGAFEGKKKSPSKP